MQDKLIMVTMNEEYAKAAAGWKYEGDYAIYNMPSWEDMCRKTYALTIKENRESEYKAFITEDNRIIAMCRYVDNENGLKLGVGVNPDYLSRGVGTMAVKEFTVWLRENYPDKKLYLDVRSWNKRAVNCYIKSGYVISETFKQTTPIGEGEFYRLFYAC